jgi:hypothetical protein
MMPVRAAITHRSTQIAEAPLYHNVAQAFLSSWDALFC